MWVLLSSPGAVLPRAARYVHWGVVQISLTNLLIIAAMLAVFVLALLLPFPADRKSERRERSGVQR